MYTLIPLTLLTAVTGLLIKTFIMLATLHSTLTLVIGG
jgi:hypothetical protein